MKLDAPNKANKTVAGLTTAKQQGQMAKEEPTKTIEAVQK